MADIDVEKLEAFEKSEASYDEVFEKVRAIGFCWSPDLLNAQLSLRGAKPTRKTVRNGRIMYIERKADGLTGSARIGRVTFSKSGRTLYYAGRTFQSLKGNGFKCNYYDVDSGEGYWISGPRRDGRDRLYGERTPIEIDDDVREEYWRDIRRQPERADERVVYDPRS